MARNMTTLCLIMTSLNSTTGHHLAGCCWGIAAVVWGVTYVCQTCSKYSNRSRS
jgi:peptide methionine sulfoxide reductase MsrA